MNHLIAKTNGRKSDYYKVISDKQIFELPDDLANPKAYDSDYKLEDDEWFHIPTFSTSKYCIPLLKKVFISADYTQISAADLKNIKYLCAYQSKKYFFQKISSGQLIAKKWFEISNAPTLQENSPIIVINDFADAIYDKDVDILYFKKLSSITSIFKGIDELYREATQEETETFLGQDFIKLEEEYAAPKVKNANRKRIAMAMDTLNKFSPQDKTDIFKYIKGYCKNLPFDTKKSNFTIKSEEDLKLLLWGIEQRYYTTPVSHENRVANSVSLI